jgi:hypothetical protein
LLSDENGYSGGDGLIPRAGESNAGHGFLSGGSSEPSGSMDSLGQGCIDLRFPKIRVKEEQDFVESFKHFSKPEVVLIARALVRAIKTGKGMIFDELRLETKLDTQSLNHALISMRNWGFVIDEGKQRSKRYYITKYGYIIYLSFETALDNFDNAVLRADELFDG